jgi:hypothetical protein
VTLDVLRAFPKTGKWIGGYPIDAVIASEVYRYVISKRTKSANLEGRGFSSLINVGLAVGTTPDIKTTAYRRDTHKPFPNQPPHENADFHDLFDPFMLVVRELVDVSL